MEALAPEKEKCILVGEINQDLQNLDNRVLRRIKDITYGMCVKHEAKNEPEPGTTKEAS